MAERESSNAEEAANVVTQRRSKRKRVIPRKSLDFVTLQQQADEDSSTSTPASEESDRPVAAGKGKKRVSVASKARGGKRGSRKTRGRCFEGDEEERLVLLHEQRKKQADDTRVATP
ncbi:uncharacterized protein LOC127845048 isoform X2 [Dreissena polymorpha]|uniref:Uncharacterized protein n=1 Tax=Dreissena polymorpha TaxID=45954 RepID=A0A9D4IFJ5_DREPO|nr:uncharacterized protein LOC127845048 isoform X2 [Dreissena polymorpha]KAH3773541.1 hypothetical protein DPMN_174903 [Dreissena polymorpha]